MAPVEMTIDLDAPPEVVFAYLQDMSRTPEWVTICREVLHTDDGTPDIGWQCKQRYVLRGAPFVVSWTLDELEPGRSMRWSGKGPARSTARIEEDLEPLPGGGTRLRYLNEFKAPGGIFGAAASKALVGDTPEREAKDSLEQLAALIAREQGD